MKCPESIVTIHSEKMRKAQGFEQIYVTFRNSVKDKKDKKTKSQKDKMTKILISVTFKDAARQLTSADIFCRLFAHR